MTISAITFAHTVYIQLKYIQNQVVYYFGKSVYRQSRPFLDFPVSAINTVCGILCGDIMSEHS